MDAKLIITQAITLLYLESQLSGSEVDSKDLIKDLLKDLKPVEGTLNTEGDRDLINGLRSTVFFICEQKELDRRSLLQRLRFVTRGDEELFDIIKDGLIEDMGEDELRKRILAQNNILARYQKEKKFKEIIRKWTTEVVYSSSEEGINVTTLASRMQTELENFVFDPNAQGVRGIPGVVSVVNCANLGELNDTFKAAEEETSNKGILRTGWQAMNRMLGWHDGFRRGDFVLIGALQHNFKTGMVLKLLQQVVTYNKPYLLNPEKKPLILQISSENALTDNLVSLYEYFYSTATGKQVDPTVPREVMSEYVKDHAGRNGYHLEMLRIDPTDFTFQNLFQLVWEYETQGYELHAIYMDYLQMLSKEGCFQGPTGSDTRDLFRRVRNFMNKKKITFFTPHQISTEAKYLLRVGCDSFVKEIVNKGYYDSCKTIDQEVDVEILIHKVEVDDAAYLEMHRGKHRKSGLITPPKDLYTVLPFNPGGWGGILDDLNGGDTSSKKPGAKPAHEGGGTEWYQFAA